MPIETMQVAGAKLRVRTSGAGARRLLFATDPPNLVSHYAQLAVALAPHARVAVFEPPGFGHSKGRAFTLDAQADAALALAERLGGPTVLAFPCVMAYAALVAAARRPDLVSGLVLIQAPSFAQERAWAERVDKGGLLRTPVVGQTLSYLKAESIAARWYDVAVHDAAQRRVMKDLGVEAMSHGATFPLASAFQALFRGEPPSLPRVEQPVLAVWGAEDPTHRESDAESIREHAPRAKVVRVEGAAHFPELEQPKRFADEVLAWMDAEGL